MKIIRRYEGNLIAYEYAVLNLRMKRKGGTSLSTDEVQAFFAMRRAQKFRREYYYDFVRIIRMIKQPFLLSTTISSNA